ncbi:MAG: hypothetical protein ACPGXK_05020 [Phycisphaerae bacterium]
MITARVRSFVAGLAIVFLGATDWASPTTAVAGEGELVYSNTNSDLYFPPGAGRRIADDILTDAICNCILTQYSFTVTGNGDGTGEGFTVEYAMYDDCPNGGGAIIPGTEGVVELPDNGTHLVTHIPTDKNLALPNPIWLAVEFDNSVGGWLVGSPPEVGFSDDIYDFPQFDCEASLSGNLFASFDAQIYCTTFPPEPANMPLPLDGEKEVSDTPVLTWNNPLSFEYTDPQPQQVIHPEDFVDGTKHPSFFLEAFQTAIDRGEVEDPRNKPFPQLPVSQTFGHVAGIGAPPVTDDDLYLFEDTNDLLANPFSLGQALELMRVATVEVLTEYGDSYDFVAFFLNFQPDPGSQFGGAFYSGLANDVDGIGVGEFSNLNQFGLPVERLQGWVMMWNQASWSTNQFSFAQLVLGQEFQHRFGMYLAPLPVSEGGIFRPLQGQDDGLCGRSGHWNFRVDGQGSGMEIADWTGSNPAIRQGGTLNYNTDIPDSVFSYPDLYLMGYVSGEEMDNNSSELRYMDENFNCSSPYDGPISTWNSTDIKSENGVRVPSSFLAQKNFSTAWVVIHRPGAPPTTSQMNRMTTILNHWNDAWVTSTLGRGVMTNVLSPPDPCDPTYDVLVDTVNPPVQKACSNVTSTACEPGLLASETTHYWQVITQQPGAQSESEIWSFTTEACGPASAPTSPSPGDNANGVELSTELTWSGGNNVAGGGGEFCATTYDVFFGQDNPPTQMICGGVSIQACDAPLLEPDTVYYWQVEANTPGGAERSPVWSFTSRPCSIPVEARLPFPADGSGNIDVNTPLSWNNENKVVTFNEVGGGALLNGLTIANVTFESNAGAFVLDIDAGSQFLTFPAAIQGEPIEPIALNFQDPVYTVSFAYLFSLLANDPTAVEATFLSPENEVIDVVIGGAMSFGGFGAEGVIDYVSSTPVARVELNFTYEGAEFMALDNIGYNTVPVVGEICDSETNAATSVSKVSKRQASTASGTRVRSESWVQLQERITGSLSEPRMPADASQAASTGGIAGGIACPPSYDVYFGEDNPPKTLLCSGLTNVQCQPPELEPNRTYFWQVMTRAPGQINPGPVWSFSTPCQLVDSSPAPCGIDARQNFDIVQPAVPQGWRFFNLEYACSVEGSQSQNFEITVQEGAPPFVLDVSGFGNEATVELLSPIPPGQWTCIRRSCTTGTACLGSLPGDVNGDRVADFEDVMTLRDHLDGEITLGMHQVDINHSNEVGPEDLLRLIDLLNGGGAYEAWHGETLGDCKSLP